MDKPPSERSLDLDKGADHPNEGEVSIPEPINIPGQRHEDDPMDPEDVLSDRARKRMSQVDEFDALYRNILQQRSRTNFLINVNLSRVRTDSSDRYRARIMSVRAICAVVLTFVAYASELTLAILVYYSGVQLIYRMDTEDYFGYVTGIVILFTLDTEFVRAFVGEAAREYDELVDKGTCANFGTRFYKFAWRFWIGGYLSVTILGLIVMWNIDFEATH